VVLIKAKTFGFLTSNYLVLGKTPNLISRVLRYHFLDITRNRGILKLIKEINKMAYHYNGITFQHYVDAVQAVMNDYPTCPDDDLPDLVDGLVEED